MPDYSQGKIYKIVNSVNDKVYIGSTVLTLAGRMSNHRVASKTQRTKIYKVMRCHGVENFKIELIKDYPCKTKEQLLEKEFQTMKKYISSGIVLYNTTTVNGKTSEKTERKMSEKHKGMHKGSKNNNYGKVGTASALFNRGSVYCSRGKKPDWRYQWHENRKRRTKNFSVNKYGYDEAKRLVEEFRDKIYPIE